MPRGKKSGKQSIQQILLGSWWVLLFTLLGMAGYRQATEWLDCEYDRLLDRRALVVTQIATQQAEQADLLLQIRSQSDPDWLELTLQRELGLVKEGYRKVYFKPENRS